MRIQFTVSQSEWNTLKTKSIEEGYPDVPSYCKDIVLKQRTYAMLWNTVTKKIESMPSGKRFLLKDLIKLKSSYFFIFLKLLQTLFQVFFLLH